MDEGACTGYPVPKTQSTDTQDEHLAAQMADLMRNDLGDDDDDESNGEEESDEEATPSQLMQEGSLSFNRND